jgi:hypothetical protein
MFHAFLQKVSGAAAPKEGAAAPVIFIILLQL